jgi:hypothetical protein
MFVYEKETFRSEAVCVKEYNAINMADLEGVLGKSEKRKAPGLDENNKELQTTREK